MPQPKSLAGLTEAERLHLIWAIKCGICLEHYTLWGTRGRWEPSILPPERVIELINARHPAYQYRIPPNANTEEHSADL